MKPRPAKQPSDLIANQTRLAEEIHDHFKISCSKQAIQNWQRKHNPAFPPSDVQGRYSRKACFAWVEENVMSSLSTGLGKRESQLLLQQAFEAEARLKITKDNQAQFQFEILKGKFIERDEARVKAMGALKQYHSFVQSELEKSATSDRREKLTALGTPAEIIAAFFAWDLEREQKRIDRIAARCETASQETDAIAI